MKIDHKGQGMSIELDKVPSFLYINEEGHGCGQVYVKGVRIKPLVEVRLKAKTNTEKINALNYSIQYYEAKEHVLQLLESGISQISECLTVKVSVTDTDIFKTLCLVLREFNDDEKIPIEIRRKYIDEMSKILQKVNDQ